VDERMSGCDGSHRSLLDGRHANACDGQEFASVDVVPFGQGFAVVFAEWCAECGAVDWDLVDLFRTRPEDHV
jgi:hypothetical protein